MRSRRAAVVAALGLLALTGCTGAPPEAAAGTSPAPDPGASPAGDGAAAVDADALQAWIDAHPVDQGPRNLAGLTGAASPADPDDGGGSTLRFADPIVIGEVELVCFGEGLLSIEVAAAAASSTRTVASEGVPCAEGPHVIGAADLTSAPIHRVDVRISDATSETAWRVVFRAPAG